MIFLEQLATFMGIVLLIVTLIAFVTLKYRGVSLRGFLKNSNGALPSAVLAFVAIAVLALVIFLIPNNANAGTWFNDAGVYMGVDYTKGTSPQCEDGDPIDARGTSNLGVWANGWESSDGAIRVNARYTHHSCVLGEDEDSYDGLGVIVEWKLWQRRR